MTSSPIAVVLSVLLFLGVVPEELAIPEACFSISYSHEPGVGHMGSSTPSFSHISIMIPGPNTKGEMGTHQIYINMEDLKRCVTGLVL